MDTHSDVCAFEAMLTWILGVEDEVYGDKVHVVDLVFVE